MNALKETKKKHLLAILKYLYLHNSSTMNELVGNLQLSQPSIRNMVRILQEKQLIQEVGNDLSSGGRCPTRFALNEKNYLILCLYIQVDKIIYQVRGFSEIKKEDTLFYQGEEELKKIIRQLVDKNEVHCCQIAVEGIVYEDEYVTDHQNILKKHHWVKDIKKEIDLPIQLQNDVKMIHQGCYFTYQQDTTYYLYINEVGIGSSYFYKDEPLYGNTGIMGEIGLISFKGKTINQRIRECQSQDEFNELLGLLVSMIFTMLDPTRLELSLDLKWNYEEKIIKNILNKIDKNCFKNLYFHKDISSMLFEGLAYRGIVYLLKERIERDEKYKAIIYDIDGTLLDTLKMNMYPLMKIIKEETGEDWTFEQVLKFAAYPGMKVMEELGVKDQEKTYARWVQYVNDYEDGATLFEGFEEVLETFKNKKIKQAIVSSKLREQYEIDIVSKGIDQYMEALILQDDTTFHKPHPEPLLKCIEKLNLKPEEVIYIGDAQSDYEASKNAHIDFGLAKWGSVATQEIPATLVFKQPKDLLRLLKK